MSRGLPLRQREIGGDALHRFERQVLDLWDQGVGTRGIASKLGADIERVRRVVSTYDIGRDTTARFRAEITRSSNQLLNALRVSGGSFK